LLAGDMDLFQIKSNLVDMSTMAVAGLPDAMHQLAQIGITITSNDFGKSGMLELDTSKLESALNNNASAVSSLFFNDSNGNGKVDPGEDGVASRLSNYMNQLLNKGGTDTVSRYENTDTGVSYTGAWSVLADSNASGGSVQQSATANDYAEFTFTGSAVAWYATKGADQGIASVYIDGVYKADIDLYSATTQNKQNVYSIQGLSAGQHTIKIVVSGSKNGSSSGINVNIDALDATFTNNTGIVPEQQDELQGEMSDIDDQIASMNDRLDKTQQTLVQKFTAMELALSQLQQMNSRFQAALNGMGSGG
jgi:flagellar capping protein FliD